MVDFPPNCYSLFYASLLSYFRPPLPTHVSGLAIVRLSVPPGNHYILLNNSASDAAAVVLAVCGPFCQTGSFAAGMFSLLVSELNICVGCDVYRGCSPDATGD